MCYMYHVCVVGQSSRFTTSYHSKKVSGRIGHSVKFAWKFSGDVELVTWALANDVGTYTGEKVVSLDVCGADVLPAETVPVAYRGRVNGTRTGDSSTGQATFTLYNVRKDDERLYCCLLSPGNPDLPLMIDFVRLVVVGMYLFKEL